MKIAFICSVKQNLEYVYSKESLDFLEKNGFDGICYNKQDLIDHTERFSDTEYIFSTWGMPRLSETEIKEYLPSLKCVFYAAGSVQSFAAPFLNCNIRVFSAWAANAIPVAEYTVAQIILANKGFFRCSGIRSKDEYIHSKKTFSQYIGNYDARIGIIGAGMIGKLVIKMLREYELQVLVFDPFLSDDAAYELGVEKCSLEKIFGSCNVVSNHLADNQQTRGMLNAGLFSMMQENATFLNTGRGAQVVESDLCGVLSERPDIVAVLDVTSPEPPRDNDPFYSLPNCILTPHIAGSGGQEVRRMSEYIIEEYKNYISGAPCRYEVTSEMLKTMA